ncbi:AraC family transcriptional regulator [Catenulispora subtropica]|uniref:HTH araC/xylS-type domain-containing protein n=1 Tax=Catenulispora subtropica TaxID=450798 RepID=A0ABN2T8Z1_9ACTN
MSEESIYLNPSEEAAEAGLVLDGIGRTPHRIGQWADCRPVYTGLLLTAGYGEVKIEGRGRDRRVGPGSFCWLPPRVPHVLRTDDGGWSDHWIQFHGPATEAYERLGLLAGGPLLTTLGDMPVLINELRQLALAAAQPESVGRDLAAGARLHRIIQLVHQAGVPLGDIGRAAVDHLVQHALESVDIQGVARRMYVSYDTLAAKVKALTGCSPMEFVIRERLAHARDLLTTTALPISAIAEACGYDDPSYFARQFTARVGVSPKAFRLGSGDRDDAGRRVVGPDVAKADDATGEADS